MTTLAKIVDWFVLQKRQSFFSSVTSAVAAIQLYNHNHAAAGAIIIVSSLIEVALELRYRKR